MQLHRGFGARLCDKGINFVCSYSVSEGRFQNTFSFSARTAEINVYIVFKRIRINVMFLADIMQYRNHTITDVTLFWFVSNSPI